MENIKYLASSDIGYLSLAVCIMTTATIDEAFDRIAPDPEKVKGVVPKEDSEDIVKLKKQGLTWPEIGEIFNISYSTAYRRAKRFNERKEKELTI